MTYRKYFRRIIYFRYPAIAPAILKESDSRYLIVSRDTLFSKHSSNPLDKRLDFAAYFLAFIKALNDQGLRPEEVRVLCLEVAGEMVRPKNRLQKWMKQLPPKLLPTRFAPLFIRALGRKVARKGHPDGFRAGIITDKEATYGLGFGVDILECGICKLFKKHQADEYSNILCEVDKITSGLAGLKLVRSGTIASGAVKCDFRFRRIQDTSPEF